MLSETKRKNNKNPSDHYPTTKIMIVETSPLNIIITNK